MEALGIEPSFVHRQKHIEVIRESAFLLVKSATSLRFGQSSQVKSSQAKSSQGWETYGRQTKTS